MKKIFLVLIMCLLSLSVQAKRKHPERWYQEQHCKGQVEYKLDNGMRVDCLTEEYAVEYDFAPKWAEAIGQSLYYAHRTQKKPAIVLIVEHRQWFRYVDIAKEMCQKYGISLELVESYSR